MSAYPVKSEAARAICQEHWSGHIKWPKEDLCADCQLVSLCRNPPTVTGIEAHTQWVAAINAEAARIEAEKKRGKE